MDHFCAASRLRLKVARASLPLPIGQDLSQLGLYVLHITSMLKYSAAVFDTLLVLCMHFSQLAGLAICSKLHESLG